jgi:hypothetical protein
MGRMSFCDAQTFHLSPFQDPPEIIGLAVRLCVCLAVVPPDHKGLLQEWSINIGDLIEPF